jgi:beta-lactam-binding protein with PASTA domain
VSDAGRGARGDEVPTDVAKPARVDPATPAPDVHAVAAPSVVPAPAAGDAPVPDSTAPPPRRHRIRGTLSLLALALAAFATGLLLFNNVIMPRLIHSVAEVRIPDLTNLSLEQAERTLKPVGIVVSRAGERFDPSVPRGFILSQDPPADTPVRGRKRVMVVVSLGEEFSSVPSLAGESLRGARQLVESAGLRVAGVTRAPSDRVGAGLVVDSDPPAETVLPRDATVGLLVSSGSREESFVMPDLLGREITGARRALESFGFQVITPPAAASIGTIVFQDPAPGSRIARGATIVVQATGRMIR